MDHSKYGAHSYGYGQYPPGYAEPNAQQAQYANAPPQIRNPFAPPSAATGADLGQNAKYDPEYDAQIAQWQSAYVTPSAQDDNKKGAQAHNIEAQPVPAPISADGKKKTVIRKGGGQTWEDSTLLEWDPTQFRIMVGNLAGEVTDDSLAKAFAPYGVSKARVVRDKRTTKSRGYGFVSFTDGEMGFKAAREMVGKYIGSHPVTIQRSKADIKPVVQKDHRGKGKNSGYYSKNKQQQPQEQKKGAEAVPKKSNDPLRAHTGAHIVKPAVKNPSGLKMLG